MSLQGRGVHVKPEPGNAAAERVCLRVYVSVSPKYTRKEGDGVLAIGGGRVREIFIVIPSTASPLKSRLLLSDRFHLYDYLYYYYIRINEQNSEEKFQVLKQTTIISPTDSQMLLPAPGPDWFSLDPLRVFKMGFLSPKVLKIPI